MPIKASNYCEFGWKAKDFQLLSVDEKYYTLNDLKGLKGTIIAFICNHCPYVLSIVEKLSNDANELIKYGVNTIAIMPNDVINYPDDSFENMKIFSKKYKFNFHYLYDEKQIVAKEYQAICTPDFYGFDSYLKLQYRGRIDSSKLNSKNENNIKRDLFEAMIKISKDGKGPIEQYNSLGCSIKWKEK